MLIQKVIHNCRTKLVFLCENGHSFWKVPIYQLGQNFKLPKTCLIKKIKNNVPTTLIKRQLIP